MSLPLILQSPAPAGGGTTVVETTVRLAPDQMELIGNQINGAALWMSAFYCVLLVAVGALLYVRLIGGR